MGDVVSWPEVIALVVKSNWCKSTFAVSSGVV